MEQEKTKRILVRGRRFLLAALLTLTVCGGALAQSAPKPKPAGERAKRKTVAERVLEGARREVANGTVYGASGYYELEYPGGDVPAHTGVCTDLIVRAFRNAGIDLQALLHEDRKKNRQDYAPHNWVKGKADANIDHRRCTNLVPLFRKRAKTLTNSLEGENPKQWKGGDVVFFVHKGWKHPWHVAIVSDKKTPEGTPYIVHLFPEKAAEVPIDEFVPIHSHFRWTEDSGPKPSAKKQAERGGGQKAGTSAVAARESAAAETKQRGTAPLAAQEP
ncbi:MAG TPA: DUF1287 domain-containing protein [Sumerlaeia bacterium]|nr:DUF1287 domain-containing protein [Sumerlaeia bacterium]